MESSNQLKRSLGLATVVALGLNGVIGQGVFLTPGVGAEMMGPSVLVALLLGGFLCFLIALCFAEVGGRFKTTGGAYVYAREAFGDFIGFEVGWMTCCVAVVSWAALANGFTKVLSYFLPALADGWAQTACSCGVVALLTGVNLMGARSGANVVKFFTVAKLIPITLFIVVGFFFLEPTYFEPFAPQGMTPLADTVLLLLYAYAGFETLVVPAGEMDNPKRSVPLALFIVMAVVTTVYLLVFSVAIGTFPELPGHDNPIADASRGFMGPAGATLIAVGIVLSVFGTNSGSALVNPRRFYALAERGDLPRFLARVSPKTGAPYTSILVTGILVCGLTLTGSFAELAALSVVARFMQYIPTCLAVLVFRKRHGMEAGDGFRVPFGPVIPLVAVGLCTWLLIESDPMKLVKGLAALIIGRCLFIISRWKKTPGSMHWLLNPRILRQAHLASIVVPLSWWVICYAFWVGKGCRAVLPFISEFDMYQPEDTIFTVGVSLTTAILFVRVVQLYLGQRLQIEKHSLDHRWARLNLFSLGPAMLGVVSATWLAYVPWNENLFLHENLANCVFYGGVTWCVCTTALTWRLSQDRPELKSGLAWRIRGSIVATVGLLGMIQTAGREIHDPDYDRQGRILLSKESPMEYCSESYSALMDAGAAFEWILILGILSVTWTFASDLRTDSKS